MWDSVVSPGFSPSFNPTSASIVSTRIKKIVVIGPECTGKSTLSAWLATHYNTRWVPEYAREFLEKLDRPYEEPDLLAIARGQLQLEDVALREAKDILICDTNLYVIKIWSEFKFGRCHPEILEAIATRPYDLYLLSYVDVPWEEDPQREHPDNREELYQIYLAEMKNQSVPFVEVKGSPGQRQAIARTAIDRISS